MRALGFRRAMISFTDIIERPGEVSLTVAGSKYDGSVWFRSSDVELALGGEALLALALLAGMKSGASIALERAVSPRVWRSLSTIQDVLATWYPELRRVSVDGSASLPLQPVRNDRGVACFFSGGVDSFYSLLKHRSRITHLVFVYGFDIGLDALDLRSQVSKRLRQASQELELPLVEIETNLRQFYEGNELPWGQHSHGAALATVALLLHQVFREVIVAASNSYADLHPWGSHPLLDILWSSEATEIVHDGCEADRMAKIVEISRSDVAMRHLRVCWENRDGKYNCGTCDKCLLTAAALSMTGALERCETLPSRLKLGALRALVISKRNSIVRVAEILTYAQSHGYTEVAKTLLDVWERSDLREVHFPSGWLAVWSRA